MVVQQGKDPLENHHDPSPHSRNFLGFFSLYCEAWGQETCSREQEGWEAESRGINCIWVIRENWSEKKQQASRIDVSLRSGARDFE